MNAPKQHLPEIQRKKSSPLLPFPGIRMNDTGVLYSYAEDEEEISQPFPGIRFHSATASASAPGAVVSGIGRSVNKKLSSGTRVLTSSKARLREVMKKADSEKAGGAIGGSPVKDGDKSNNTKSPKHKDNKGIIKQKRGSASASGSTPFPGIRMHSDSEKPTPPMERRGTGDVAPVAFPGIRLHTDPGTGEKSGSSPVPTRRTTESAGILFPGVRMHDPASLTASASSSQVGDKKRSESIATTGASPFPGVRFRPPGEGLSAEEEQFFKSHPGAFEVGNISNERVEHEEEKRKSKGMLSGLKDAWRLSGGKSRTNSVGAKKT
jgi:hypothetical protein